MESDKTRILLAEDDKNLGTILKSYLEAKGFPTTLCVNGQEAFEMFSKEEFDFCIVDVMMPVKDGFTLAKDIRNIDRKIPIIFLTAKSLQQDKLKGFEVGADDYLTKPFNMDELLMRIQAILRRLSGSSPTGGKDNIYTVGKMTFDFNRQILSSPISQVCD